MEKNININIFLGKNGEGKSSLFEREIKRLYNNTNRNILVVCNSIYSRYKKGEDNGYRYFGLVRGRVEIESTITKFIARSLDDYNYKKISGVLNYLAYEDKIGFNITFNKHYNNDGKKIIEYTNDDRDDPYINAMLDVMKEEEIKTGRKLQFGITYSEVEKFLVENSGKIIYFDESMQDEMVTSKSIFKAIVQNEKKLKRIGLVKKINYFVTKGGVALPIAKMSSGERYLLGLMFFLSTSLSHNTSMFIDEPENSLHPQWQIEYINKILEFIRYENAYYNDDPYENVRINIATHSPLIALFSGEGKNVTLRKFNVKNREAKVIENKDSSVEDIYMDLFNVLTPKSRSLSNHCSELINEFIKDNITYDEAMDKILNYKSISVERKQAYFLSEIVGLLELANKNKSGK